MEIQTKVPAQRSRPIGRQGKPPGLALGRCEPPAVAKRKTRRRAQRSPLPSEGDGLRWNAISRTRACEGRRCGMNPTYPPTPVAGHAIACGTQGNADTLKANPVGSCRYGHSRWGPVTLPFGRRRDARGRVPQSPVYPHRKAVQYRSAWPCGRRGISGRLMKELDLSSHRSSSGERG